MNNCDKTVLVFPEIINSDRLDANYYKAQYLELHNRLIELNANELGKIAKNIKDGPGGWDVSTEDYVDFGIPVIRSTNLKDGFVNLNEDVVYISEEKHYSLAKSAVRKNDVLLSVRGTIGKSAVYNYESEANLNAAVVKITLKDDTVDPYYLSCFFNSRYGRMQTERIANGAVQNNMNLSEVKSNLIPLPNIVIQRYIGNKLRKAEELQEEARRLKEEVKDILESNLCMKKIKNILINNDEKFTWVKRGNIENRLDADYYKKTFILIEEIYLKNGIKLMRLEEILDDLYTGTTPNAEFISNEYQEIKFLRVDDLSNSLVKNEISLFIKEEIRHSLRIITPGSVLVSIAGTIGRSAVINLENCTTNQNVAVLQLKESIAKPYYLSAYFNSPVGRLFLERVSTQATVKYINNDLLKSVKIPVIDIETQSKIQELLIMASEKEILSKLLISEAKQDVEDLIEGKFNESKVSEGV